MPTKAWTCSSNNGRNNIKENYKLWSSGKKNKMKYNRMLYGWGEKKNDGKRIPWRQKIAIEWRKTIWMNVVKRSIKERGFHGHWPVEAENRYGMKEKHCIVEDIYIQILDVFTLPVPKINLFIFSPPLCRTIPKSPIPLSLSLSLSFLL